jgi:hypothetical protein
MHTPPGDWLVPPVVLPELLENAVTHNQLTADNPLDRGPPRRDRLTVSNDKRPRRAVVSSTGVGLEIQLDDVV